MLVTVKLHGVFRINRFKEQTADYPQDTKVGDIVRQLCLPDHILGIILVNDVHSTLDASLRDGDILSLLPILDGG